MKRLMTSMMVLLGLVFASGTSWADETPPPTTSSVNSPLTKEDAAKLKEVLERFGKLDGDEKKNPPPATSSAPPKTDTSMAKVADKALDMLGSTVAAISQNLQKVAPEVWRIMIRQQYAKAVFGILTPTLFFVFFLVGSLILWKKWTKRNWGGMSGDEACGYAIGRYCLPLAAIVISAAILFCSLGDSIKLLINPEYYAVKDILTLVSNPGKVED